MDRGLKECPFCGEQEVTLKTRGQAEDGYEPIFFAHVACTHCGAQGSSCGAITLGDAIEQASIYWNDVKRPGWDRTIKRWWSNVWRALRGEN